VAVTGELIADTPDRRVEILLEADAVHATRTRLGPRRAGTDPHVHRRHNDVFYVLDGELTLRLGPDGEVVAPAGTLVVVPPLVVHGYRNAGDGGVRFLNFHAPAEGFAAHLRALRDGAPHAFDQHRPPADGGRPAADAIVAHGPARAAVDAIDVAEAASAVDLAAGDWIYVLEGELATDGVGAIAAGGWAAFDAAAATTTSAATARLVRVRAPGRSLSATAAG
jgi:quercetin dioxygenase-like cupin family protein